MKRLKKLFKVRRISSQQSQTLSSQKGTIFLMKELEEKGHLQFNYIKHPKLKRKGSFPQLKEQILNKASSGL
jgi:uncharacterized protein (DUF924 family)